MLQLIDKNQEALATSLGFVPPVSRGLRYANFFGSVFGPVGRNLVRGESPAAVTGAPALSTASAAFVQATAFLQTTVSQAPSQTVVSVSRPANTNTGFVVSQFQGPRQNGEPGTSLGVTVWYPASGTSGAVTPGILLGTKTSTGGATNSQSISLPDIPVSGSTLHCMAARIDSSAMQAKIWDLTSGAKTSAAFNGILDLGTLPYRIGSSYGTDGTGAADIACLFIFDVALTDAEIKTLYAFLQGFYLDRFSLAV